MKRDAGEAARAAWTPEREAELTRRVRDGEAYRAIAAAMGITKNQAIGKAQRLGLGTPRPALARAEERGGFPAPGCCLWPLGDAHEASQASRGGRRFCGAAAAAPGAPYCAAHRGRAVLRGPAARAP